MQQKRKAFCLYVPAEKSIIFQRGHLRFSKCRISWNQIMGLFWIRKDSLMQLSEKGESYVKRLDDILQNSTGYHFFHFIGSMAIIVRRYRSRSSGYPKAAAVDSVLNPDLILHLEKTGGGRIWISFCKRRRNGICMSGYWMTIIFQAAMPMGKLLRNIPSFAHII